jgi:hypothetical protein
LANAQQAAAEERGGGGGGRGGGGGEGVAVEWSEMELEELEMCNGHSVLKRVCVEQKLQNWNL